ncbi:NAD(P)/FAD-dependent oxidoreductase [Nocardia sp. BMG111209]|uniref:flavin-containing monooxygenase n=1 Tax=Nocardia sp. BMG111209 TaxID=1160137 RepID=UPI000381DE69|nr:NAD(P)/FAD-dependent oxidoreductase [Nocardia sp. BMG111209]
MSAPASDRLDAIVIGAGFAGIYMLHKLRNELGLRVLAFEKADGVGGTWYWNKYPGACSDVDGIVYRYSFDRELLRELMPESRYVPQAQTLALLNEVVDRNNLRGDIRFGTGVVGLTFDEDRNEWTVRTDDGAEYVSCYVVGALGPLSERNFPEIEGRESFAGRLVHTGAWPDDLDITGKRVGVIGTGSTGTQFICAAAPVAGHLTVFQRSPQYVVPAGNGPLGADYLAQVRDGYDAIWEQVYESRVGCGFQESDVPAMSVSAAERTRVFEQAWQAGSGFRFMFGTFGDIAFDPDANEAAAAFIRAKIAATVRDPETARLLTPTGYYAKRPICNDGYYDAYNRDNVKLVSVKENPIQRITPAGVVTADGVEHQLDVLVFATGFDAIEGSYDRIDVRGSGGRTLREHWSEAPTTYLGVATNGFPNLFMVFGPNSVFCNLPPGIESQVEWISDLIAAAEQRGAARVETTVAAEDGWTQTCRGIAEASLFAKVDSWIFGANIPGKKPRTLFYFGGLGTYRRTLRESAAADFDGFVFGGREVPAAV